MWRNYKGNLEINYKSWKKNKRNKENNRSLQIFCLYSLSFQKEVRHFLLLFILLLPLKDLLWYLSLRKLLKKNLKMRKITRKLWGDIVFKNPKERLVLVSKSVPFPFLILKKRSRRTIWNRDKKRHYINRSLLRIRFQRKSTFPTRSAWKEQIAKQWLWIYLGRNSPRWWGYVCF